MVFQVDEGRKKALAFRRITSTLGGKLAVGAVLLAAVLAIAVPWYLLSFTPGLSNDPEDGALPEAIFTAGGFGTLAIGGAGATWRQRNRGVSMRTRERLFFDGMFLEYSFHPSADRWPEGRIIAKIEMESTRVSFDSRECKYLFSGGVHWEYYEEPAKSRMLAYSEMSETANYEIGAYFGGEFDRFMEPYLARSAVLRA